MNQFAVKYREAQAAAARYRDAPRIGWADPKGRKTVANQTIAVGRKEAEEMALALASALHGRYVYLYETLALINYMDQIAYEEPDAIECKQCHNRYLPGWMDGKCPYCAARDGAQEKVSEMLR